jgi:hypothetical protein
MEGAMLKLVYDLTIEGLIREISAALEQRSSYERIALVSKNSILHAAVGVYGRKSIPEGCDWLKCADEIALYDSSAPVIFIDSEPTLPLGRRKIALSPDHGLMSSVPRVISILLDRFQAAHFIDAFDARVTVALKSILICNGILSFLEAVVDVIRQCDCGKFDEISVPGSDTDAPGKLVSATPMALGGESESLREFLEKLCQTQDPHGFLKAYVSYYSYLKSNRNISEASRTLNISRTTLHDHLRLARSLEICPRVEASFPELMGGESA